MNEMLRYAVVLGIICVGASASLGFVNSFTKDRIIAQAQAQENESLQEVMPQARSFEAVKQGDEVLYYKALGNDGEIVGFCFKASGKGYSSLIETVAGMNPDGSLTAIKVVSQNETPGLGTRVQESSFASQFKGRNDFDGVQTIAGATISSRAVIASIRDRAREIKDLIANGR
jgi:Na+-translocating ferredoxin:NAD+ oxidoreductase subunit G